jgi:hypothetical protein
LAPTRPFYANDLAPAQREKARAVCVTHGVLDSTALEACTLDATVLGTPLAAKVFSRPLGVRAVLKPNAPLLRLDYHSIPAVQNTIKR